MGTEGDGFDSCEGTKGRFILLTLNLQRIQSQKYGNVFHNSLYHLTAFMST